VSTDDVLPLASGVSDIDAWTRRGASVLYLVHGDEIIGAHALEDKIRWPTRPISTNTGWFSFHSAK
jgi:hypothetical protein